MTSADGPSPPTASAITLRGGATTRFSSTGFSNPLPPIPRSVLAYRVALYALPAAGAVVGLLHVDQPLPAGSRALLFASLGFILVVLALDVAQLGRRLQRWGSASVLLGADGRVSTSKSSMWLWTLGLAYAILYLTGVRIFDARTTSDIFGSGTWDDYLILVGGPFAAGVLAKYTVVSQVSSGAMKSVVPETANPTAVGVQAAMATQGTSDGGTAGQGRSTGLSDVVSNDDGGLDLVDAQYFVFNLVAFAYAAGVFLAHNFDAHITAASGQKYALPAIPGVLLALTGASAATYVAHKAVQVSGPRISFVSGTRAKDDSITVTIAGTGLVPAGAQPAIATAQTAVWLQSPDATGTPVSVPLTSATPTQVVFMWPSGYPQNPATVFVVRLDGSASPGYPFDVTKVPTSGPAASHR